MVVGDIVTAVLRVLKDTPYVENMVRGRLYRGAVPPNETKFPGHRRHVGESDAAQRC
jgi:hypothetical protein